MRYNRRNLDLSRLQAFKSRRRNLDLSRLSSFRARRNIDLERLYAFRQNPSIRPKSYIDTVSFRRNPAPDGKPWGPSLYNPLEDTNHEFKDDSHYKKVISKLRRNPSPECLKCGSYGDCVECRTAEMPWTRNRFNPSSELTSCENCGWADCDCSTQSTPKRNLRRRNPIDRNIHEDGCSSCGLRFGLHARTCSRRDW